MIKINSIKILTVLIIFLNYGYSSVGVDYNNQLGWDGECLTGTQQSPININTKGLNFCPNFKFKVKFECKSTAFINGEGQGYAISSNGTSNVGISDQTGTTPQNRLYKSYQYHFHAPS
jgi:carbonic anhydrase